MARLPCKVYNTTYEQDSAIVRTRLQWGLMIALFAVLFSFPLFASNYVLFLANTIGIILIVVHGLNILSGYTGQLSLGQAGFMAVGAYTSAVLCTKFGFPFWAAMPCAGLSAGLLGLLFGLPSLRIRGFYLVLATIAAQFIIVFVVKHLPNLTGGVDGMSVPSPELGGFVFESETSFYFITLIMVIIMTFFAKNLARTRSGRAFIAIRDNDKAAEVMGINLFSYKLLAFFICCFYAGIGGSLWAHHMRFIGPENFELSNSIWYLGMVIIGGLGSTTGAVFGTIFVQVLDELVRMLSSSLGTLSGGPQSLVTTLGPILFGLIIIIFLIFEPRGLAHRWEVIKAYYRLWPLSY